LSDLATARAIRTSLNPFPRESTPRLTMTN